MRKHYAKDKKWESKEGILIFYTFEEGSIEFIAFEHLRRNITELIDSLDDLTGGVIKKEYEKLIREELWLE